jgi:SOS response regulatory protein OraA/RecX
MDTPEDPSATSDAHGDGDGHGDAAPDALRAAMDRLSRRGWSRGELIAALARAGFGDAAAEAAVETCVARGWLDESQAARDRADRLRRRGPVAPDAIVRDLERHRVPAELAARVAAETVPDPVAEAEAAVRAAIARRGATDDPADALPWRERLRLAARLARRGFDEETICTAMRRVGVPIDESPDEAPRGGPVDLYD